MDRTRRNLCFAAALACLGGRPARAAPQPPLRLGLMPVYDIRALLRRYEPMRGYLGRRLDHQVRLESAPDFPRYLKSILAGEFDIAVAAAHFARIAQLDAGWIPLAQFDPDHDTMLITRSDRKPAHIADLAGSELAVIDRLAITVMGALHYLGRQGLQADRDYRVVEYHNHDSVLSSLMSGASAMAVTTTQGLRQVPNSQRERIAVYRRVSDIPAFVVMAAPTTPIDLLDRLRSALLAFPGQTEGRNFLAYNGYSGLHAADEKAMRRADPYLKDTRRMVAG